MLRTRAFLREAIEQQISEGKTVILKVTGKSMRPYLLGNGNESIVVSKYKPDELKSGKIILFSHDNRIFSHRIVTKANEVFITQGDGVCNNTESIQQENILAMVRYIIRDGKKKSSPYCFSARIYWQIWYGLRPIRKYLLFIYNRLYT
ncbi:MAG: hypothetical protein LBS20_20245 [Prevotella sp.]|jgi:signal peptidase I|nr:hypothetical protein [Prevotella sp.]